MTLTSLKLIAVIYFMFVVNPLQGQNITPQVNDESGNGISDVVVFIYGEAITKTNEKGFFKIPETYQIPIEITLKHPDYYIRTVILTRNNIVIKLFGLEKTQDLDEVVISSTYQKESQVIIPTRKITSQKFEQYSPIDLVSAINETPGVFIQSGALNTNRIVIRGVGSRTLYGTNKIRAYFNGIPITNGIGETVIDIYDPEDIANLEIVKGPKATQYGTNLGGTLLINSKQALPEETYAKSSISFGDFGLLKNNISVATANKKVAFNFNYDHLELDGFRENSNYNRNAFLITSDYSLNSKNEIGLLINYTDYIAQIPSSISKTAFEENPAQAAFTWNEAKGFEDNKQILAGLNYTHRFSETFSNTTSIFFSYLDHYEPRPFNILDEYTNGYGSRTLFAKDFEFADKQASLSFGSEIYRDQYNWKTIENLYEENGGNGSLEGDLLSDNKENRNNLNVFATVTLPFTENLKVQVGVNFNKTKYEFIDKFNTGEANKTADRNFDPIFAPNLNMLYQLGKNANIYANTSRGFNYPSIEETLTPEGVVNPELAPEKGYNYEIGTEIFLFKRKIKFQLSTYLIDIKDLLVAERVDEDQYIGRNAGRTEHKGIELSILFSHNFNNYFSLASYINTEITDHRFIDFIDDDNNYSGNKLTGVPNHKINGGIDFQYKGLKLNTNFINVGDMPLNDSNTLYSDAYTIFNFKVAYKKNITKDLYFECNAGVNNFTDRLYASSILINAVGFGNSEPRYYYPGTPRNWFGGFKIGYTI